MTKSIFSEQYRQFRLMLVEARKDAGYTQIELSMKLSKPQSFVSKYERGERRLDIVEFLEVSHVLGFNPAKFLKTLDQKHPAFIKKIK